MSTSTTQNLPQSERSNQPEVNWHDFDDLAARFLTGEDNQPELLAWYKKQPEPIQTASRQRLGSFGLNQDPALAERYNQLNEGLGRQNAKREKLEAILGEVERITQQYGIRSEKPLHVERYLGELSRSFSDVLAKWQADEEDKAEATSFLSQNQESIADAERTLGKTLIKKEEPKQPGQAGEQQSALLPNIELINRAEAGQAPADDIVPKDYIGPGQTTTKLTSDGDDNSQLIGERFGKKDGSSPDSTGADENSEFQKFVLSPAGPSQTEPEVDVLTDPYQTTIDVSPAKNVDLKGDLRMISQGAETGAATVPVADRSPGLAPAGAIPLQSEGPTLTQAAVKPMEAIKKDASVEAGPQSEIIQPSARPDTTAASEPKNKVELTTIEPVRASNPTIGRGEFGLESARINRPEEPFSSRVKRFLHLGGNLDAGHVAELDRMVAEDRKPHQDEMSQSAIIMQKAQAPVSASPEQELKKAA